MEREFIMKCEGSNPNLGNCHQLHPSHVNWQSFLTRWATVTDKNNDVIYYRSNNRTYAVNNNGDITII